MRKLAIVLIPLLLLTLPIGAVGCGDGVEGALPVLNVGDKWIYRLISDGVEYTLTETMIGYDLVNGTNCYVVEVLYDPPLDEVIDTAVVKGDSATFMGRSVHLSGEYMDRPYVATVSYSLDSPSYSLFPLNVGKEVKVTRTEQWSVTMMGELESETVVQTYTYRVEKKEEIDVPAGTFKCFKIVKYDEHGTALETRWHSDKAKSDVKWIDHETEDVAELISYSLR